jgi:hypothetical protein
MSADEYTTVWGTKVYSQNAPILENEIMFKYLFIVKFLKLMI